MRTIITGLAVAAALALVAFLIVGVYRQPAPVVGQECTMEAKICPDGSSVGRTGPNCEFAACSPVTGDPTPAPKNVTVRTIIGQTVNALDVSITPLSVQDDSRCPIDVQCIWAGTIHVRVTLTSGLGTAHETFEIGSSITTEAEIITLTEAAPYPKAGVSILPSDYVFTFDVAKR